jgi:hypothetical protein
MSKTTTLADGDVTAADRLSVELVQPIDLPATILIRWPGAPSVTDSRRLHAVADAITAIMAQAVATLARIRGATEL